MDKAADNGLNPKQQAFVREYLLDFNATRAYKAAGYSPKSEKAAQNAASRLLGHVGVQKALAVLKEQHSKVVQARFNITKEDIAKELATIGFGSLDQVFSANKDGIHIKDQNKLRCVKSISFSRSDSPEGFSQSFSAGMHDKVKALELLGKTIGMFDGTNEGTDNENKKLVRDRVSALLEG